MKHIKSYEDYNLNEKKSDKIKTNGRFVFVGDKIKLAGKSKYPVGTKIKIKNLSGEDKDLSGLTGTLTHPFGFCHGSVGVYLNKKGVRKDNKICLNNSEYEVVDDEALELLKKHEVLKEDIDNEKL